MFSACVIISISSASATSWKGGFLGFLLHPYTFPFIHVILPPKSVCNLEEAATLLCGKELKSPTPSMTLGTLPGHIVTQRSLSNWDETRTVSLSHPEDCGSLEIETTWPHAGHAVSSQRTLTTVLAVSPQKTRSVPYGVKSTRTP